VSSEFQINTYTENSQAYPAITTLANGDLAVVWDSTYQDGAGEGIYGQILREISPPENLPPNITSNGGGDTATVAILENATAVATVAATDPDDDFLSYSISGGADAGLFTINSSTGALSFASPRDFETPADADRNNVYEVTVQVSDGESGSDNQSISVTVENVVGQTITGTNAGETRTGTGEEDNISGRGGSDTLRALAGNDTVDGGTGADRMEGGLGDDTYYVDNPNDNIVELSSQGLDQVFSSISYSLTANVENLNLTGSSSSSGTGNADANIIVGNNAANLLTGLAGADTLRGNGGADSFLGGTGVDLYEGGSGNDRFYFTSDLDVGGGDTGLAADRVQDFVRGDLFDFSLLDARTNLSGNNAFTFIGANEFSGVSGQLHYQTNTTNDQTYVEGDTNGDRIADFQLQLSGRFALAGSDFVL
jgi:Ca2+-binding RTX toxin-like protein